MPARDWRPQDLAKRHDLEWIISSSPHRGTTQRRIHFAYPAEQNWHAACGLLFPMAMTVKVVVVDRLCVRCHRMFTEIRKTIEQ